MNAGDRVGAMSHAEDKVLYVFGFGTYIGEKKPNDVPQKPSGWIGDIITKTNCENPVIELDDGNYVWGCECWFGSEEDVRAHFDRYDAVETLSILEKRTSVASES